MASSYVKGWFTVELMGMLEIQEITFQVAKPMDNIKIDFTLE
jgi:hypothetical protein